MRTRNVFIYDEDMEGINPTIAVMLKNDWRISCVEKRREDINASNKLILNKLDDLRVLSPTHDIFSFWKSDRTCGWSHWNPKIKEICCVWAKNWHVQKLKKCTPNLLNFVARWTWQGFSILSFPWRIFFIAMRYHRQRRCGSWRLSLRGLQIYSGYRIEDKSYKMGHMERDEVEDERVFSSCQVLADLIEKMFLLKQSSKYGINKVHKFDSVTVYKNVMLKRK